MFKVQTVKMYDMIKLSDSDCYESIMTASYWEGLLVPEQATKVTVVFILPVFVIHSITLVNFF